MSDCLFHLSYVELLLLANEGTTAKEEAGILFGGSSLWFLSAISVGEGAATADAAIAAAAAGDHYMQSQKQVSVQDERSKAPQIEASACS